MASRNTRKSRKTNNSTRAASTSDLHEEEELLRPDPQSVEATLMPRTLHPWLQFDRMWVNYNLYAQKLYYLLEKDFELSRYAEWGPLEAIGMAGPIRALLTQRFEFMGQSFEFTEWERLFAIKAPVFRELCLEFHSTIKMQKELTTATDKDFLKFRLGGHPRSMSLRELAASLSIYTPTELEYHFFDDYLMSGARLLETDCFDEEEYWLHFSEVPFAASGVSHTDMNDVHFRIIHRFLAHTIANRRENTEKITLSDIWYLRQIREGRHVNIPFCVAAYLNSLGSGMRTASPISGGQFITLIARYLGIDLGAGAQLTKIEGTQKSVGYLMFHATQAVSKDGRRYIPYVARQPEQAQPPRRQRARQQQQQEDLEQMPGVADPSFLDLMQGIQGLQLGQQEMGYRLGNLEYQTAWNHHNIMRMAEDHGFHPTPSQPLYQWGSPQADHPPPVYDPVAALEEAQRLHQEQYREQQYHEEQRRQEQGGYPYEYYPF